jgi:hypothetical protein
VYLIDWSYGKNQEEALGPYFYKIFESELLSWNYIKNEWPQKMDYELFLEWFEVMIGEYLFDSETEPIEFEKL